MPSSLSRRRSKAAQFFNSKHLAPRIVAVLHFQSRRGVTLVISDPHEGIKASASRVFSATWLRCRVHFSPNALAHAGKSGRRVVSTSVG